MQTLAGPIVCFVQGTCTCTCMGDSCTCQLTSKFFVLFGNVKSNALVPVREVHRVDEGGGARTGLLVVSDLHLSCECSNSALQVTGQWKMSRLYLTFKVLVESQSGWKKAKKT